MTVLRLFGKIALWIGVAIVLVLGAALKAMARVTING